MAICKHEHWASCGWRHKTIEKKIESIPTGWKSTHTQRAFECQIWTISGFRPIHLVLVSVLLAFHFFSLNMLIVYEEGIALHYFVPFFFFFECVNAFCAFSFHFFFVSPPVHIIQSIYTACVGTICHQPFDEILNSILLSEFAFRGDNIYLLHHVVNRKTFQYYSLNSILIWMCIRILYNV